MDRDGIARYSHLPRATRKSIVELVSRSQVARGPPEVVLEDLGFISQTSQNVIILAVELHASLLRSAMMRPRVLFAFFVFFFAFAGAEVEQLECCHGPHLEGTQLAHGELRLSGDDQCMNETDFHPANLLILYESGRLVTSRLRVGYDRSPVHHILVSSS